MEFILLSGIHCEKREVEVVAGGSVYLRNGIYHGTVGGVHHGR